MLSMPSMARHYKLRLAPVSTSCRAVRPATEHSSVALGLRAKLRFADACPRPSKSGAFRLLRRPGNLHSGKLFMPSMAQRFRLRPAPVLPSMASRSSGHRAQLGGARSAHEAALRKRLPSPLEKRCFSSASQTGQPAFWRVVHAIPGAALLASTGPGLAIHGKPFGPRKALLFVCFADRATCILASCSCHPWRNASGFDRPRSCHPWQAVRPSKSCAFRLLRRPGLTLPRTPAAYSPPDGDLLCADPEWCHSMAGSAVLSKSRLGSP